MATKSNNKEGPQMLRISFEESLGNHPASEDILHNSLGRHAAHCMIWAKVDKPLFGLDKDKSHGLYPKAAILMHVRFDGKMGFPGGMIDEPLTDLPLEHALETVVNGVNRELIEEINFDTVKYKITEENYQSTHTSDWHNVEPNVNRIFNHFFTLEVLLEDLHQMEMRSLSSSEHGREVMGNFRIPLFTMLDKYRGFPAFLDNNFAGNSRQQLIEVIVQLVIMNQEEVEQALKASKFLV